MPREAIVTLPSRNLAHVSAPYPPSPLAMMVQEWIRKGRELGASDLHIEADTAPVARIRGQLSSIGPPVAAADVVQAGHELLGSEGWSQFLSRGSADLSRSMAGVRCRINIFQTLRGAARRGDGSAPLKFVSKQSSDLQLAPGLEEANRCNHGLDCRVRTNRKRKVHDARRAGRGDQFIQCAPYHRGRKPDRIRLYQSTIL
jgi:hypothetical protein